MSTYLHTYIMIYIYIYICDEIKPFSHSCVVFGGVPSRMLLSWYALRGEVLRPPPCTPPPALIFKPVPLATYYSFLFA